MHDVLSEWQKDDMLKGFLLTSSESQSKRPAFCAGGDVKSVYESGLDVAGKGKHGLGIAPLLTADFFREEYKVNHALATWKENMPNKPQVSIWNGVVMGGGVGLSIHGKYRVSTEHTLWGMPETGIGLFPDVGSTFWMPRLLQGGIAPYLALTGTRLHASDLLYTGMATHYVPSKNIDKLQEALIQATKNKTSGMDEHETLHNNSEQDVIAPILMSFHETPPSGESRNSLLSIHREDIDEVFGDSMTNNDVRVEDIVRKLEQLKNTEFAKTTLEALGKMSPTSMKITLEGLKRGSQLSTVGECLQMEYRMSQACMRENSDFYRGIRAVLVDKDHNPQWEPSNLKDVSDDMVESYFQSLGQHEWEIPMALGNSSKL